MNKRKLRGVLMGAGVVWGQLLLVAGIALIFIDAPAIDRLVPAVGLIGAGLFVAMWLVADPLVPDAGPGMVAWLKFTAVLVFYTCSALTVYGVVIGRGACLISPL